ncbi:MAG TPA: cobalamin-dependent protein, partial [Nitrospirota bacterium]|nr:cobalamin-dependent protein [Nitrospirota bacterium]
MNILIISTNRAVSPMPVMPIGACVVAEAAERAGHFVALLDLMFAADPLRAIEVTLRRPYDLIGLSVRNIDNNDMYGTVFYIDDLASLVHAVRRRTDAPIVLGGASLTIMPEEILRAVEAGCAVIGDGEVTFPRLLERMERHEPWEDLPGIAFLKGGTFRANPSLPGVSNGCAVPGYHRWLDLNAYRLHLST